MNDETKKKWEKALEKRIGLYDINIRNKLKRETVKALSYLARKIPSLYMQNGIKVKIKTFWGGDMVGVLPDGVASIIYLNGFFEEGLTKIVMEYLDDGMTFVDIGAHCGYFSLLASEIVGRTGQVHSFEPTKSTFKVLEENLGKRENAAANNVAVFSKKAELEFKDFGLRYSAFNSLTQPKLKLEKEPTYKKITVKAIPLDDYVESTGICPDFVKIDAEGAEMEILKGMQKTIEKFHPMLVLEVGEDDDSTSRKNVEYLIGLGYVPYCYEGGEIRPHKIKEKYGYDNILFLHGEKGNPARI